MSVATTMGERDAVTEVAQIEVSLHLAETVGPGKQIKYGHIGGQIEDARVSQYASDQRDSDKATVGIDRSVTLQPEICRASLRISRVDMRIATI